MQWPLSATSEPRSVEQVHLRRIRRYAFHAVQRQTPPGLQSSRTLYSLPHWHCAVMALLVGSNCPTDVARRKQQYRAGPLATALYEIPEKNLTNTNSVSEYMGFS